MKTKEEMIEAICKKFGHKKEEYTDTPLGQIEYLYDIVRWGSK